MSTAALTALLPLLVLAGTAVILLVVIAFYRHRTLSTGLVLAGLAAAFLAILPASDVAPQAVTALLVIDGYALFYVGLLLVAAFVVAVLSHGYLARQPGFREEYDVLLLLATLGSAVLAASTHFASFFLGLEILSVSLYGLIAYPRHRERSLEAGVKYLVLAAASSAFLLFGMALAYADQGTLAFEDMILRRVTLSGEPLSPLLLAGLGLMIVGLGFKLAIVPFHMWAADVYEGAAAPVTAFVATVSKGGVFALLVRFLIGVSQEAYRPIFVAIAALAIASMLAGNLLALLQRNVKRMLAYSSIAHLGYLLVAFLASGSLALTASTFYLVAYIVTTLAAFGIVTVLSTPEGDADDLEAYQGLFWRRPGLAAVLAASLFSLAGMPLTAGFVGKLYLVAAGVGSALWLLVIVLAIGSAVGLYYYLRWIVVMYRQPGSEGETSSSDPGVPLAGGAILGLLLLVLVWLGVYPAPLLDLIEAVVAGLV
jgi:NADH-quinone oxidoreductase subunit N